MKKTVLFIALSSVLALTACQKADTADQANTCYGQKAKMLSGLQEAIDSNTGYVEKIKNTSWITPDVKESLTSWLTQMSTQFKTNIEFIREAKPETLNENCTVAQLGIVTEINNAGLHFIKTQEGNIDQVNATKDKTIQDTKCGKTCDTVLTKQWLSLNQASQKEFETTVNALAAKAAALPENQNKAEVQKAPEKSN